MDSLLRCYILYPLLYFGASYASFEEGSCRELTFQPSLSFANGRLKNHIIKSYEVHNMHECEWICYQEHDCVSVNFETEANTDGKHRCELNNSTHAEHGKDLINAKDYIYRGTENACGKSQCKNGGTCQSGFTQKRYRCLCTPGFNGDLCHEDINECSSENECHVNATCANTKGSYNCTCKEGYGGDGKNCSDIDECSSENNCHVNATCKNIIGSYNCTCKKGYGGDGRNCSDINECSSENECHVNATCANTKGSYNCTCKEGYGGDGRNCSAMMNSVILSSDGFYLHHLAMFLSPVIGDDSRWELCYRSSTHGTYDYRFHSNCDGKSNTVTIVKKNDFVFGGFTDIPWESPQNGYQFGATEKAFIFSLRNAEELPPFKSNVKNPSKAIRNHKFAGPTFGQNDILIDRHTWIWNSLFTNFGDNYIVPTGVQNKSTLLAGASKFKEDEVEVFFLL
ncbi:uncharacterized protein [Montipora foliosa]|uniref:uncharacterized protein isoform X2 n=1 Tax=Montipora foliosa TaxID=591990 RepID=UPI0035F16B09